MKLNNQKLLRRSFKIQGCTEFAYDYSYATSFKNISCWKSLHISRPEISNDVILNLQRERRRGISRIPCPEFQPRAQKCGRANKLVWRSEKLTFVMEISVSGTVSFEEGTALVSTWLVALTRVSPRALLPGGRKEGKTRTDRKHARRGKESLWQETARTACEEAKLIAIVIVERKASQSPAKTLNCGREKQKTLRRAKDNSTEAVQEALDVPSSSPKSQLTCSGSPFRWQKEKKRDPHSQYLFYIGLIGRLRIDDWSEFSPSWRVTVASDANHFFHLRS